MLSRRHKPALAQLGPRRGTRITPRTCLWPLAGSLVVTFGLSIGLTFQSSHHCYAATCGEWLFPLQARLHVIVWYSWLSISVTFLAVRAFHPQMQKFLAQRLCDRKLPLIGVYLTRGGGLMACWVIALYAVAVGIWWIRLREYFVHRGLTDGVDRGGGRLAAVAQTGHLCDITMGMVLLPISRHSALASFFKLTVSVTLTNHMLTAYALFALTLIHGALYVSWLPIFDSLSGQLRMVFPVLNPTYLYHETWPGNRSSLGLWRASLVFSGLAALFIMLLLFATTLRAVRSKHFNLFYFTHLLSVLMVVIICLHASTMFYCIAPGLAMWLLDWGMRVHELRRHFPAEISSIGNGWYCITVPLPRSRLAGCSCRSPLAHFYIHHANSSIRELHPFTTITHLASKNAVTPPSDDYFYIKFLFRKQGSHAPQSRRQRDESKHFRFPFHFLSGKASRLKNHTQWTDRLAGVADEHCQDIASESAPAAANQIPSSVTTISLRLEGPYFSCADPSRYTTAICLVAGTGISGAIAIANAFAELQRSRAADGQNASPEQKPELQTPLTSQWRKCIVLWSVKYTETIDLPFLPSCEGLELQTCLTGPGHERMDMQQTLQQHIREEEVEEGDPQRGRKIWVYISGPKVFIEAGEKACRLAASTIATTTTTTASSSLDYYAASWEI